MAVLAKAEILRAVSDKRLVVDPWDESAVQGASIDLRLGKVLVAGNDKIYESGDIRLPSGCWALLVSLERIEMPLVLSGRCGLRMGLLSRGLSAFVGPQIDPGYKGRVFVNVFNTTGRDIYLEQQERFVTVEFCQVTSEVDDYVPTRDSEGITFKLRNNMRGRELLASWEVIDKRMRRVEAATRLNFLLLSLAFLPLLTMLVSAFMGLVSRYLR